MAVELVPDASQFVTIGNLYRIPNNRGLFKFDQRYKIQEIKEKKIKVLN
jgi:hypothetical protein